MKELGIGKNFKQGFATNAGRYKRKKLKPDIILGIILLSVGVGIYFLLTEPTVYQPRNDYATYRQLNVITNKWEWGDD